jgi:hypothetical protein
VRTGRAPFALTATVAQWASTPRDPEPEAFIDIVMARSADEGGVMAGLNASVP